MTSHQRDVFLVLCNAWCNAENACFLLGFLLRHISWQPHVLCVPVFGTVDSLITHTPSGTFYALSIVLHGIAVTNYHKYSYLVSVEYH